MLFLCFWVSNSKILRILKEIFVRNLYFFKVMLRLRRYMAILIQNGLVIEEQKR